MFELLRAKVAGGTRTPHATEACESQKGSAVSDEEAK